MGGTFTLSMTDMENQSDWVKNDLLILFGLRPEEVTIRKPAFSHMVDHCSKIDTHSFGHSPWPLKLIKKKFITTLCGWISLKINSKTQCLCEHCANAVPFIHSFIHHLNPLVPEPSVICVSCSQSQQIQLIWILQNKL